MKDAEKFDREDPLAAFKSAFALPEGLIYLDGNSLGPAPAAALARLRRTAEKEWRDGLIRSWNDAGWIDLPMRAGAKIAKIIGVDTEDVIVADSVSANVFKLAAALKSKLPKARIAAARDEFPTDRYVLAGLTRMLGEEIHDWRAGEKGSFILVRSVVDFRTGAVEDVESVEREITRGGGRVIWDLSHAAGVLNLRLKARGVRFAVGCGYKFLNGGPGAPAFLYVRGDEAASLDQPLQGWMGHARPFDFAPDYAPADGVARLAAGTPNILSLAALDAALDLFEGVDMGAVESKARALGDYFIARALALGLKSVSPGPGELRGGQASFTRANAYEIMQALIANGVIGDFRPPDVMRFGFSPLFLSYCDVARASDTLADILETEEWRDPRYAVRRKVT